MRPAGRFLTLLQGCFLLAATAFAADGTVPVNIVDSDKTLWVAGNLEGWIGQMDRETGGIGQQPMPEDDARDAHTWVLNGQGLVVLL